MLETPKLILWYRLSEYTPTKDACYKIVLKECTFFLMHPDFFESFKKTVEESGAEVKEISEWYGDYLPPRPVPCDLDNPSDLV